MLTPDGTKPLQHQTQHFAEENTNLLHTLYWFMPIIANAWTATGDRA